MRLCAFCPLAGGRNPQPAGGAVCRAVHNTRAENTTARSECSEMMRGVAGCWFRWAVLQCSQAGQADDALFVFCGYARVVAEICESHTRDTVAPCCMPNAGRTVRFENYLRLRGSHQPREFSPPCPKVELGELRQEGGLCVSCCVGLKPGSWLGAGGGASGVWLTRDRTE